MTNGKSRGIVSALALLLMGLASLSSAVYAQNVKTEGVAQNVKVEGVIKGRSGDTLLLQTVDGCSDPRSPHSGGGELRR
jgi:hypothetical protein